VNNDPAISGTLGPSVQETPANAVGMLGWDLRLLQQGRYKPVQNALYGISLATVVSSVVTPGRRMARM